MVRRRTAAALALLVTMAPALAVSCASPDDAAVVPPPRAVPPPQEERHPRADPPGAWRPGGTMPLDRAARGTPLVGHPGDTGAAIVNVVDTAAVDLLADQALFFSFETETFAELTRQNPKTTATMPVEGAAVADFVFNEVLAFGGVDVKGRALQSTFIVAPSPQTLFTEETPRSSSCLFGAAATVVGDAHETTARVLLAGGADEHGALRDEVDIFDHVSLYEGSAAAPLQLQRARKRLCAVGVEEPPRAVFIGGEDDASAVATVDVVDVDDPAAPVMEAAQRSLRSAHTRFTATVSGSQILVVGGRDADGALTPDVELIDFSAGDPVIVVVGALEVAREDHAATLIDADHVVITGGFGADGTAVATTEVFSFSARAWLTLAPARTPRGAHAAIAAPGGRVVIIGGRTTASGDDLATSEVLQLPPL
jgi:hypothetical protein